MKRRTKEQMIPLINKWKRSNKSKQDYCSQHGMKVGVFYYWLSKLEKEEERGKKEQGKFLSMEISRKDEPTKNGLIELHYPNGVRLVLHELQDLSALPQLIQLV